MTERLSDSGFDRNYENILSNISAAAKSAGKSENDIILLAATKTQDIKTVNYAIERGIKYIGENRVQEFLSKKDFYLPVKKHFIGHLQSNKVKYIVGECELIHSVDSFHLAKAISDFAAKKEITQDILLEVNIGKEESKSGIMPENLNEKLCQIATLPAIRVKGLMAIPPISDGENKNAPYFDKMYKLFIDNGTKKMDNVSMEILSMGMSDDYACAVKCGANLVRIGTALFGKRKYI